MSNISFYFSILMSSHALGTLQDKNVSGQIFLFPQDNLRVVSLEGLYGYLSPRLMAQRGKMVSQSNWGSQPEPSFPKSQVQSYLKWTPDNL